MIDISAFVKEFSQALDATFAERVWFVGLQGSYARGEAQDTSDIDMVVVLDELSASDIRAYHAMLNTLPHRELLCGFLCGKSELLCWEPFDLFHLYYDTKPIKGSLDDLLTVLDETAISRAISFGVCSVYHGCVHNMLYNKSNKVLKGLYKSASFAIQTICFKETGNYISRQEDLLRHISSDEKPIINTYIALKNGVAVDFEKTSEELFAWAKKRLDSCR